MKKSKESKPTKIIKLRQIKPDSIKSASSFCECSADLSGVYSEPPPSASTQCFTVIYFHIYMNI